MDEIAVTQDLLLSSVWIKAVRDGKIINEFKAINGEKIQFGLALQNGRIEYYAKNIKTGCEMPALVEEKMIGQSGFVVQFNGYRALKPGGRILNIGKQPDISDEAVSCRFYCQDSSYELSILKRDPLIQIALPNYKWNGYYNATPFEKEGHFLWLPVFTDKAEAISHIRQELSRTFLEDALALFRNSDRLMIFFNSLHAGASVNHIHLQAIFHKKALSIESASITRQGRFTVLDNYPARGIVFHRSAESDEVWPCVDYLQKNSIPFNLIFVGDRICLIPRNPAHELVTEFPTIIASTELSGKIITADRNVYDNVSYTMIQRAFQKTTFEYYSV